MADMEKMRASIADILSIPLDELKGDTLLESSDFWDSMARISIVALVFETTGTTISGEEIEGVVTVQDIFDLAAGKVKGVA
ncbi:MULTISPECIES: acyl carrier protein [Pseudomonas]|uniref:Acyl carrier protein n=1 Tax=Pseudomonas ekonensis TaxID=2842353 RepID=A0ABS6PBM2_9PSED|nr:MULTISPECIES: acyl carrier protein [Pseudomonas]MBV4457865.1 acyl carrier protein [Pseudomonas ekonensis]